MYLHNLTFIVVCPKLGIYIYLCNDVDDKFTLTQMVYF
jgi:hypothetical protein